MTTAVAPEVRRMAKVRRRRRGREAGVFRGGDGGVHPTHGGGRSPYAHGRDNARRYLTCQEPGTVATIETADRADSAHDVRDGTGMLVPGGCSATAIHARPRRYARACMRCLVVVLPGGRREEKWVGWDSGFDDLYEMQARLDGVAGLGRAGNASGAAAARDEAIRRMRADLRLRDIFDHNRGVFTDPTAGNENADDAERWLAANDPEYAEGGDGGGDGGDDEGGGL